MKYLIIAVAVFLGVSNPAFSKEKYLTERDIRKVRENWKDYVYAAEKVDIPILLLPALHYREADLHKGYYSKKRKKVIKNVGGPFMLDLGPLGDHKEFARRIREYEKRIYREYGGTGKTPRVSHDFWFAALLAADHLKKKARCDLKRIDCIVDAVWGYNGRAWWQRDEDGDKTHRASSYVWSDPKNGNKLLMRYKKSDGSFEEFYDTRPGVMIIYNELTDLFNSGEIGNVQR